MTMNEGQIYDPAAKDLSFRHFLKFVAVKNPGVISAMRQEVVRWARKTTGAPDLARLVISAFRQLGGMGGKEELGIMN